MRDATGPSRSILDGSGTLLGDFDVAKLYCEVSHDYIMLGIGIVDRLSLISGSDNEQAEPERKRVILAATRIAPCFLFKKFQ